MDVRFARSPKDGCFNDFDKPDGSLLYLLQDPHSLGGGGSGSCSPGKFLNFRSPDWHFLRFKNEIQAENNKKIARWEENNSLVHLLIFIGNHVTKFSGGKMIATGGGGANSIPRGANS